MEFQIPFGFILSVLLITGKTDGSNTNNVLKVEQPEHLTVEVGGSVTINCTFVAENVPFSVTWSVCEEGTDLKNHSCFKQRVSFEDKYHRIITIRNLTENDSAKYCCRVESNNKKEDGKGTMVHVKAKECPEAVTVTRCSLLWLFLEVVRITSLLILIILVSILIKKSS